MSACDIFLSEGIKYPTNTKIYKKDYVNHI